MFRNLITVGGWTMVSRLLGLIRDQLLAAFLGAGALQDAYQVAFRLPNMFRRLFGEGAFNAAFVPLFGRYLTQEGEQKATDFASEILSLLSLTLVMITILGEIFMPWVIALVAPGFDHDGRRFDLGVTLTRITFPYLLFICLAALAAGILNGLHRFACAAAAYVTFNIVGISAILIGAYWAHNVALCAAWGVTLSGVVQLAFLVWALRREGVYLSFCWPKLTHKVHVFLKRLWPGLLGSGATQLNLTIDTLISTLLPAGSISWIYFADRVNQLPLGVLGAAAGTTLLPVLSRHITANNLLEAQESLNRALKYAALLSFPASLGLLALAPEIMATLFGYGHFRTSDVLASAQALRAYALGLPAFILIKVLSPAFFATDDTRTPVRIGLSTLVLNLLLNLLLYKPLAHVGPPLASALSAWVNLALLGFFLRRRGLYTANAATRRYLYRTLLASVVMAIATLGLTRLFAPSLIIWHGLARTAMLAIILMFAGIVYSLALTLCGVVNSHTWRPR